jgi:hypothetical protein
MATSVEKLMRRLRGVEQGLRDLSTTPRLGNSSVDDGGAIVFNNPTTGQPDVIVGGQGDGTIMVNPVNGPIPPKPTAPTLEGQLGFIMATWDGGFDPGAVAPGNTPPVIPAPLDFSRVEVHASTDPDFLPDSELTLYATIESARGGQAAVAVPYDQEFYVRLVVRSLSGKGSPPSDKASGQARRVETPDIAPFAVTSESIADFVLAVTKFKTLQHQIY